MLARFGP